MITVPLKTDDGPSPRSATAAMNRASTWVSTIPSVYSPNESAVESPAVRPQKNFKHYMNDRSTRLQASFEDDDVPMSAADYASETLRGGDLMKQAHSTSTTSTALARAQSPIPDLPSGIMSPPLEAQLFFGVGSPPTPREARNKGMPLPKDRSMLRAPSQKPNGKLSRTSTKNTTRTLTPPKSHFTARARDEAATKVQSIVKNGYGQSTSRPTSPTGFGAYRGDSEGGFSPVPLEVEDSYDGGIEQRLALLRRKA